MEREQSQKMLEESSSIVIPQKVKFDRILIEESSFEQDSFFKKESIQTRKHIKDALELREKYTCFLSHQYKSIDKFINNVQNTQKIAEPFLDWKKSEIEIPQKMENVSEIKCINGRFITYDKKGQELPYINSIKQADEFFQDLDKLIQIINNPTCNTVCYNRLKLLQQRFQMHSVINYEMEAWQQKHQCFRDFYTLLKVDTHIHHSAAMNAKQLLDFFIKKITDENEQKKIIMEKNNKQITLSEIIKEEKINPGEIDLDLLQVQADKTIFKRFDQFNSKYNPLGKSILRDIFLKTDNYIKGRYLAELTQELIQDLEKQKYVISEWRISIYGKNKEEWTKLSQWMLGSPDKKQQLNSLNVSWMIQIPRIYTVFKGLNVIQNFQQMIENIFQPIFEVTVDTSKKPLLFQFFIQITGFDSVDDESAPERYNIDNFKKKPQDYVEKENPHYAYWMYYIYVNIKLLNELRVQRGLNTFQFRPHCGEAGNIDHLAAAFLVCDGINHGVVLETNPTMNYLYYLSQLGIAMSPQSNNKLFLKYPKNPFKRFFDVGLNVSLSTDDPLILHLTNQPLLEEYGLAACMWELNNVDMAEIAHNSVIQSGLPKILKDFWMDSKISNVPQVRNDYRQEVLEQEFKFIGYTAKQIQNQKQ